MGRSNSNRTLTTLHHQPHTTLQLQHLIMPQLTQSNTHLPHLPSPTELLMTTPRLTSPPQRLPMARSPPDLTKSTFPMAVYKLLPTRPMTTLDSSLMSNTKVPQYPQKPSHTTQPQPQLMDTQPSSRSFPTLKKLSKISSKQQL